MLLPYAQKLTTNSRLKPYTFIISKFLWVKNSGTALLGPQLRVLQVCSQGVNQADFSPGGSTTSGRICFQVKSGCSQNYFLVWGKVLAFCTHQLKTMFWNQRGTTPSTLKSPACWLKILGLLGFHNHVSPTVNLLID